MGSQPTLPDRPPLTLTLGWLCATTWLVALIVGAVAPRISAAAQEIQALLLLLFMLFHASATYGVWGLGLFALIVGLVSFAMEASSIAAGFPFGYYVHHLPGPRVLSVPLGVVIGWIVLGWFGWTLARLIARRDPAAPTRTDRFLTPLIGTFLLGGYDLVADPVDATVHALYSYHFPSGLFGVPLVNFLGWLLTGWLLMQLFALVEPRLPVRPVVERKGYWLGPVLIWLVMPVTDIAEFLRAGTATVAVGERSFLVSDVLESAISCALFTTVTTSALGLVRLFSASER
ncbi:hypothetical protein GCM10011611_67540 [Aliidongia dinghuensis]|uniref:Carotenoid biosynthesis protein n=1 Tax=Aliidongia dinghuensis TaxID=1867774 RepID=A0A8J2Z1U5_9PROT|nr:carotenoid biosynthesis protein [Aliidongia dinghuensis]GGF51534.1 hypothetical protein GCM10011611_67540 [Aliidongia dinghuensis]